MPATTLSKNTPVNAGELLEADEVSAEELVGGALDTAALLLDELELLVGDFLLPPLLPPQAARLNTIAASNP